MSLDAMIEALPEYAKDLKLNYSTLVRNNSELSAEQLWGTVVAAAMATRQPALTAAAAAAAAAATSQQIVDAARTAGAIMAMNNIYYRFHHLSSNEKYATLPARLRMNGLRTHGVSPVDFELWSVAASAINGCGKCVDSHEHTLREKGVAEETIIAAVRVSAVLHAIGTVLDAERVPVEEPAAV